MGFFQVASVDEIQLRDSVIERGGDSDRPGFERGVGHDIDAIGTASHMSVYQLCVAIIVCSPQLLGVSHPTEISSQTNICIVLPTIEFILNPLHREYHPLFLLMMLLYYLHCPTHGGDKFNDPETIACLSFLFSTDNSFFYSSSRAP